MGVGTVKTGFSRAAGTGFLFCDEPILRTHIQQQAADHSTSHQPEPCHEHFQRRPPALFLRGVRGRPCRALGAARRHHRRLPARRTRGTAAPARAGPPARRPGRAGARPCAPHCRAAAQPQEREWARRPGAGPAAGVRAVVAGRRRADVPGRGAAAHSRCRDAQRAHPRQDRARPVAVACGAQPLGVRQCRHLGPAADRQAGGHAQRNRPVELADAAHRQGRRAADPQGRGHGDAHDGRAVRHRRDHRAGAGQRTRTRGAGLSLFVRHAGRSGAHCARREALPRGLRRRHPRHRQGFGRARRVRGPGHLHQALGAAPALQPRAACTRDGRAVPGAARAHAAGAAVRHRAEHRRGGSRAAGAVARPAGAPVLRAGAGGLERHRLRDPGVPEALPLRDRLRGRPGAAQPAPADGAAGEGRLLGQRDQARAARRAGRLPGLHAQGLHRRVVPGLRTPTAGRARGGVPAVRHAQRAHAGRHLHGGRPVALHTGAVRISMPARHGRAAVRAGGGAAGAALPHLCARGHPRDAAGLPGAPAAGERRQHLVREPHRGPDDFARCAGGRPCLDGGAHGRAGRRHRPAASGHCAAGGTVRRAARELARTRPGERRQLACAGSGID